MSKHVLDKMDENREGFPVNNTADFSEKEWYSKQTNGNGRKLDETALQAIRAVLLNYKKYRETN
ncbi:MAG: hypothetical protein ACLR0U_28390 [Enterocloster clostridioformis]